MKISKRGEYALRALIDIGIASELGRDLVQIRELAEQEKLPIKFLEQILAQLKGAGFISSKRGKQGGYYLRRPMNKDQIRRGDPPHRRAARADLLREPDGLRALHLPGRGALWPAHADA